MCEVASAFMNGERARLAYLDHAATTPMRETAIAAMAPYLADQFANPSGSHRFSRSARTAIDEARDDVAEVLGCAPGEVVFTSGGTEGDNAAIFGAVRRHGGVAVCSAAEHHAVLHCVEHLGGVVVAVDKHGVINVDELQLALDNVAIRGERVAVVSVMAVNNEVGSITPMRDVARVVRGSAKGAVLHSDAVQAACWLDVRDIVTVTDVVSFSAHKFGGDVFTHLAVATRRSLHEHSTFKSNAEGQAIDFQFTNEACCLACQTLGDPVAPGSQLSDIHRIVEAGHRQPMSYRSKCGGNGCTRNIEHRTTGREFRMFGFECTQLAD